MSTTTAPRLKLNAILWASLAAVVVMGAGGLMTDRSQWYQSLLKPSLQPPGALFGPAWTVILSLAVLSIAAAWTNTRSDRQRSLLIAVFALNGVLNIAWSFLFFELRRPDYALVEIGALWCSIILLIVTVMPRSRTAAALLLPYLAWVTFASYLNYEIVRLNGPFF